ncbi:MAG: thioesterase family protein [Bacteroidota bacterium]
MDISKFKHTHGVTVRNYEIDWQGIVHNGNYLLYFEIARVEYFKSIGMKIDERSISGSVRIVIVRNELDYFNSATFDDELKIYTRVASIKNSSFVCEAFMIHTGTKIPIAKNVAIMVWTDPKTGKSIPVPTEVRKMVDAYEEGKSEITWPSIEV